ncbi:MAG: TetR/AcrR family transcriptional regulator [Bacteroidetes bacterium]|nr:MAG: TetR/AcrR family transcriptional regulator [Bacteroidota bacterium]
MSEKQDTELIIKEAARDIFLKKGYAGARMQDIADKAGINKALLHYYFRSKEKLFDVIFFEQFGKLIGQVKEGLRGDMNLHDKIEFFVDKYIGLLEQSPYLPLFVINELSRDSERFIDKLKSFEVYPEAASMIGMMMQEMEKGAIKKYHPFHLLMNIMSLSVFPFIAKPMIMTITQVKDEDWKELMADRKEQVKAFIFNALEI